MAPLVEGTKQYLSSPKTSTESPLVEEIKQYNSLSGNHEGCIPLVEGIKQYNSLEEVTKNVFLLWKESNNISPSWRAKH